MIVSVFCSVSSQQTQPVFDSDRLASSLPSNSQPADAVQNDGINLHGFFGELGAAIDKTSTGGLFKFLIIFEWQMTLDFKFVSLNMK